MTARDGRLVLGRDAGETVVVQHRPDSNLPQRSEHTMSQLRDERGRRLPGECPVVAHKPPYRSTTKAEIERVYEQEVEFPWMTDT